MITSIHITTPLNYRRAVSVRSDFPEYHNFPEVYHGEGISKAAISADGQQVTIRRSVTEKYYLASALHIGAGKVSYIGGDSKDSSLFIRLLKHLKTTYRQAKTITLIVDNYIIHKSRKKNVVLTLIYW